MLPPGINDHKLTLSPRVRNPCVMLILRQTFEDQIPRLKEPRKSSQGSRLARAGREKDSSGGLIFSLPELAAYWHSITKARLIGAGSPFIRRTRYSAARRPISSTGGSCGIAPRAEEFWRDARKAPTPGRSIVIIAHRCQPAFARLFR
jgi:hypothetical protein